MLKQQEVIDRQVTQMARLVDDLLDVSRITRGIVRLKQEPLDLREVASRAIEDCMPHITQRQQRFIYEEHPEPIPVEGDPARLEQILCNLLSNASKFTEAGGQVELRLEVEPASAERPSPMVRVAVKDSGIGIAPDVLPRVFDLFVQADQSLDRSRGGLGIGLTMVKQLTALHGGRIEAASAGAGKGSQFTVRLPLNGAVQVLPQTPHSEPKLSRRRRILVVDDLADAAQSLTELLGLWGHEVMMAFNGAQAVEIARRFQPDLVLLDIGLPGEDGYEVARRLRQEVGLKDALLIAVTGYSRDENQQRSKEAGFNLHLTKPVDLSVLQGIL